MDYLAGPVRAFRGRLARVNLHCLSKFATTVIRKPPKSQLCVWSARLQWVDTTAGAGLGFRVFGPYRIRAADRVMTGKATSRNNRLTFDVHLDLEGKN